MRRRSELTAVNPGAVPVQPAGPAWNGAGGPE